MALIPVLVGAYLVGAIPFGLLLGRALRGVDIRQHGSRNIGATNAYRVLGPGIGLAVFALDFAKGFGPAALGARLAPAGWTPSTVALLAGGAAIVGHVFPAYLTFRGGKGVATSAGVLLAVAPVPTAIAAGVWGATLVATRYVSLASILAAVALPAAAGVLDGPRSPVAIAATLVGALVILRHRANIGRLARGEEPRFRRKGAEHEKSVGP